MAVARIAHQGHATGQRLAGAAACGLGQLGHALAQMRGAHRQVGAGTVKEQMRMRIDQTGHDKAAALHRDAALGQMRAECFGADGL